MGIRPRLISAASCSGAETNLPVKFHYGLPEHSQRGGWKPPGATPALRSHSSFFKEKSSRFQHLLAPEGTCHTAWGHLGQTWPGRRIKVPPASLLRRQRFIYQLIDRFVPPITELRKQLLLNTGAEERGSHFQTPFGGFSPTANQSELPPDPRSSCWDRDAQGQQPGPRLHNLGVRHLPKQLWRAGTSFQRRIPGHRQSEGSCHTKYSLPVHSQTHERCPAGRQPRAPSTSKQIPAS